MLVLCEVYGLVEEKFIDYVLELGQNCDFYVVVQVLVDVLDFVVLLCVECLLVEYVLCDFCLFGVVLEEFVCSCFCEIGVVLFKLFIEFFNVVFDVIDVWYEYIIDECDFVGVFEFGCVVLCQYVKEQDLEGFFVMFKQFSVQVVFIYVDKCDLCECVYWVYQICVLDQGLYVGKYDNFVCIEQIMVLCYEVVQLFGFVNVVEELLVIKMVSLLDEVFVFLCDFVVCVKLVVKQELEVLCIFVSEQFKFDNFEFWDIIYVVEKLCQQQYVLDEEQFKLYFFLLVVIDGLWVIMCKFYGIMFIVCDDIDVWYLDVCYYDVVDVIGCVFVGVYVDFYVCSGKCGGVWMDVCCVCFDDGDM